MNRLFTLLYQPARRLTHSGPLPVIGTSDWANACSSVQVGISLTLVPGSRCISALSRKTAHEILIPTALLTAALLCVATAQAQAPNDAEVAACKATGLIALKERSPSVKDIILDMETLAISKANTKIEDTPVRTVIMGEVYLERKETEKSQRFLCLIGEKGKVLLTFFTTQ